MLNPISRLIPRTLISVVRRLTARILLKLRLTLVTLYLFSLTKYYREIRSTWTHPRLCACRRCLLLSWITSTSIRISSLYRTALLGLIGSSLTVRIRNPRGFLRRSTRFLRLLLLLMADGLLELLPIISVCLPAFLLFPLVLFPSELMRWL
nr:MAG TPA: hypothetical protein [Microviridae sp.]